MTPNDHEAGKVSELRPCPFCGNKHRPRIVPYTGEPHFPGFIAQCNAYGIDGDPRKGCGAATGWCETEAEAIAAWNRRAGSQTDAVRAKVKTLEWIDGCAKSPVGTYSVQFMDGEWRAFRDGWTLYSGKNPAIFGTESAAQAAGQAHYERRILSALEPTPIKETAEPAVPADVQGVTEEMVLRLKSWVCEDLFPAYELASEVGRNDPELLDGCRAALEAVFPLSDYQRLAAENERLREALTPSADTKAAYMGEFYIAIERHVNEDGEANDETEGAPDPYEHISVPWTTIKEIMAAIRARSALETQEGGK